MSTQPVPNPWETAMDPPKPTYENFGQVSVNAWFCSLVKGVGKQPWDPNTLDPNTGNPARRYTAIDISLNCLTDQPQPITIDRMLLAEFGEWVDVVLPSLKDLGVTNLQTLNGQWVRVEMVGTGRTYDGKNGEKKEATTFKFLQVFASEEDCRNAWKASKGGNGSGTAQPAQAAPANGNGNGNGNDPAERETALKFAKAYVQNACRTASGDLQKARDALAPMLAGQKLLAKYFTVDSPEIIEMMMANAA